jgi:hypothetical protein
LNRTAKRLERRQPCLPDCRRQSKKVLITFKIEGNQSFSIRVPQHSASLRFATRSGTQAACAESRKIVLFLFKLKAIQAFQ